MKSIKFALFALIFCIGLFYSKEEVQAYSGGTHTCYKGITSNSNGAWLAFDCTSCKQIRCDDGYLAGTKSTCTVSGNQT